MSDGEHNTGAGQGVAPGLWTVKQAARHLQMSESWLYRAAADGTVPCVRLGKGKRAPLRFRKAELDAWVAAQSSGKA